MRISLRTITPGRIFLSDDATKLVLNGLDDVIWEGEPRHTKPVTVMPYSNRDLKGYETTPAFSYTRDLWSLGVIILEVLVGNDLVRGIRTDDEMRELLKLAKPCIGYDLHRLVERMTVWQSDKPVKEAIDMANDDRHMEVRHAIEKMEKTKMMANEYA